MRESIRAQSLIETKRLLVNEYSVISKTGLRCRQVELPIELPARGEQHSRRTKDISVKELRTRGSARLTFGVYAAANLSHLVMQKSYPLRFVRVVPRAGRALCALSRLQCKVWIIYKEIMTSLYSQPVRRQFRALFTVSCTISVRVFYVEDTKKMCCTHNVLTMLNIFSFVSNIQRVWW